MGELGFQDYLFITLLISAIPFILFLITLIDILKSTFNDKINKVIWVVLAFIPLLGPLLYFFIGRKQKN